MRLVRIRTATALAALDPASLSNQRDRTNLQKAIADFKEAMHARPDDWASYANLGSFYMESDDFTAAAACFETATRLEPRQIGPLVNASMAYSNLKQNDKAEASLRRALALSPGMRRPTSIWGCSWPSWDVSTRPSRGCGPR